MSLIDLHTHSRASDGTLTPSELVALAGKSGLTAVALTDHDTLDGLPEARQAGRDCGLEVVSGVELSVADGERGVHVLGLFLPEQPGPLAALLHRHGADLPVATRPLTTYQLAITTNHEESR